MSKQKNYLEDVADYEEMFENLKERQKTDSSLALQKLLIDAKSKKIAVWQNKLGYNRLLKDHSKIPYFND